MKGPDSVPGAEDVGGPLRDDGGELLADTEDAGFDQRFEPGFLVLEPILLGGVPEALFFRFESRRDFLLHALPRLPPRVLQPAGQPQGRPGAPAGGSGQHFTRGGGDCDGGSFERGRGRGAQGEVGATRDNGHGQERGVGRDEDEERVRGRFLECLEKRVGRTELQAVGVEDDTCFGRAGAEAGGKERFAEFAERLDRDAA